MRERESERERERAQGERRDSERVQMRLGRVDVRVVWKWKSQKKL